MTEMFSGAFCAGLIEAAALSLRVFGWLRFSGAFCAGLIEARLKSQRPKPFRTCFPALFAPASLKPGMAAMIACSGMLVFRRFLRRPH